VRSPPNFRPPARKNPGPGPGPERTFRARGPPPTPRLKQTSGGGYFRCCSVGYLIRNLPLIAYLLFMARFVRLMGDAMPYGRRTFLRAVLHVRRCANAAR
jgi:hypothetical protein